MSGKANKSWLIVIGCTCIILLCAMIIFITVLYIRHSYEEDSSVETEVVESTGNGDVISALAMTVPDDVDITEVNTEDLNYHFESGTALDDIPDTIVNHADFRYVTDSGYLTDDVVSVEIRNEDTLIRVSVYYSDYYVYMCYDGYDNSLYAHIFDRETEQYIQRDIIPHE